MKIKLEDSPHKKVTLQTLPQPREVDASRITITIGLETAAADCIIRGGLHPHTKYVLAEETLLDPEKISRGLGGSKTESFVLAKKTVEYLAASGGKAAILALAADELDHQNRHSPQHLVPTTTSGIPFSFEDVAILTDVLKRREKSLEQ